MRWHPMQHSHRNMQPVVARQQMAKYFSIPNIIGRNACNFQERLSPFSHQAFGNVRANIPEHKSIPDAQKREESVYANPHTFCIYSITKANISDRILASHFERIHFAFELSICSQSENTPANDRAIRQNTMNNNNNANYASSQVENIS